MEIHLIIALCVLVLIAYLFDISSRKTKIPTVIFLLIMGWAINQVAQKSSIKIPDLSLLLPLFGTLGLILIVLEGGLELEINKNKLTFIKKPILSALISLFILYLVIGYTFHFWLGIKLSVSFLNAIPFCVISSAIAIPSASNFSKKNKEFVIYESSMSDIFGVILFNFIIANEIINPSSFFVFFYNLIIILIISLIASITLAYFIKKIDHNVKFIPITIMVVLIYALSKVYHLPALLFILIFGIFLNNLDELNRIEFIKKLEPEKLNNEVQRFSKLVTEITFLVRTIFFLLLGYTIQTNEILNTKTLPIALVIVFIIYLFRLFHLLIIKESLMPLLFMVPRGLITVVIFISIPINKQIGIINKSLLIQVILLTSLIMMFGLLFNKKNSKNEL